MTVIIGQHTYIFIMIIILMSMWLYSALDAGRVVVKCQGCPTKLKANLTFLKLSGTEV